MRLIDGDALLRNIRRAVYPSDLNTTIAVGICESHVKDMPTIDAVPVVRCKDCRYWDKDDSDRELCMCKVFGTRTLPICFCWAGLPREDGEAQG